MRYGTSYFDPPKHPEIISRKGYLGLTATRVIVRILALV